MKLSQLFYLRDDVVAISRELLGKVLCTRVDGRLTKALITETEAYAGIGDRASHAYGGRRTRRTEPMFGPATRSRASIRSLHAVPRRRQDERC